MDFGKIIVPTMWTKDRGGTIGDREIPKKGASVFQEIMGKKGQSCQEREESRAAPASGGQ